MGIVKGVDYKGHFCIIYFNEINDDVRKFVSSLIFLRTELPKSKIATYSEFFLYRLINRDKSLTLPRGLLKLALRRTKDNPISKEIMEKTQYAIIPIRDDYYIDRVTVYGYERISVSDLHLWPPQREALKGILTEMAKYGGTTLQAVTGSGKTRIAVATHIAVNHDVPEPERRERKTFFITMSKYLVEQARSRFTKAGIDASVFHGEKQDLHGEVVCVTAQSIYSSLKKTGKLIEIYGAKDAPLIVRAIENWLKEIGEEGIGESEIPEIPPESMDNLLLQLSKAKLVIFDEAHHTSCELAQASVLVAKNALTLGLSATPWRNDGRDMEIYGIVGAINDVKITNKVMIRNGLLVPAKIIFYHLDYGDKELMNMRRLIKLGDPRTRWHRAVKIVLYHPRRMRVITEIAKLLPSPELILVREIKQGMELNEAIPNTYFAFGATDMITRKRRIAQLELGKFHALIATSIADEGLDIPSLRSLLLTGGGKSKTKAFQRVGRVVRIYRDKKFGLVVDIWDEKVPYFHDHAKERELMYKYEEKKGEDDVGWEIYHVHDMDELRDLVRRLLSD